MPHTPGRWLAAALVSAIPILAQTVPVKEHTLANGIRLLMVERHDQPTISCSWIVRVGSVNERTGITGISHMLEHMMKKGTKVVGTRDYARDQELTAQQDKVWAEIRKEEEILRLKQNRGEIADMYDPKVRSERHQKLVAEFEKLVQEQKAFVVKEEYDKIYRTAGAVGRNAFTSQDVTCHIITIPSNKLELYTWMESDRLSNAVFREFYQERAVVRDERRGYDNRPLTLAQEAFEAMTWTAHPYHWQVLGWPSDIDSFTLDQLQEYFHTYYVPNNITFALVGDLNADETVKLFERYFARIPANTKPIPKVVTLEPRQDGERRLHMEAEFTPLAMINYKTVPLAHKDDPALQLLSAVLNGNSGRLHKSLVLDKKVATSAFANQEDRKYGGLMGVGGVAADGHRPEDVEQAIYAEIEKIQKEGISDQELRKVKNQAQADAYRQLQSNDFLRIQLAMADANEALPYFLNAPKLMEAVTKEDIQRVAKQYFTKENRNVAIITRKTSGEPEDPELAKLPEQLRAMVKSQLGQLNQVTDAAKLKEILGQIEAQSGQVPAQVKPGLEYMTKKLRERIAKMEAK